MVCSLHLLNQNAQFSPFFKRNEQYIQSGIETNMVPHPYKLWLNCISQVWRYESYAIAIKLYFPNSLFRQARIKGRRPRLAVEDTTSRPPIAIYFASNSRTEGCCIRTQFAHQPDLSSQFEAVSKTLVEKAAASAFRSTNICTDISREYEECLTLTYVDITPSSCMWTLFFSYDSSSGSWKTSPL